MPSTPPLGMRRSRNRTIERHCPACRKRRTLFPIYQPPGVLYVCMPCMLRIEEAQRARANNT